MHKGSFVNDLNAKVQKQVRCTHMTRHLTFQSSDPAKAVPPNSNVTEVPQIPSDLPKRPRTFSPVIGSREEPKFPEISRTRERRSP